MFQRLMMLQNISRNLLRTQTQYASFSVRKISSSSPSVIVDQAGPGPGTSETLQSVPDKSRIRSKRKRVPQSSELLQYMEKLPVFRHKQNMHQPQSAAALSKFVKVQRSSPESLYLVDNTVAETIIKSISVAKNSLDKNATVIEFNPGFGVLTSLLKSELGFNLLNCFEDDPELGAQLVEKYGVNLIPLNFLTLPRFHHLDKLDGGNRVSLILNKVAGERTEKLYIFGSTGVSSLINFTVRNLVTQRVLFDEEFKWKENVTFLLALGSKSHRVITGRPDSLYTIYKPLSVLFQVLFEHETLGQLPRKGFIPWEAQDSAHLATPAEKYRKVRIPHDPDTMFLVQFSPNTKVLERVGRENLVPLWYFIRHHLYSRKTPVIPQLEQWIPGCGPRLIRQGFTIFTQFGSLTPQEILDVYLTFTSWPEYQSSSFLTAVEKFQLKMESVDEDGMMDFAKSTKG